MASRVGIKEEEAQPACFVRDHGSGFDMSSAAKPFSYFNGCTRIQSFRALALAWPQRNASFIGTAASFGPKAPRTRAPHT
jgi:hypothetical protein